MHGMTNEVSNSYASCYNNDKCINQIIYAMQNLLDVCQNFGTANNIVFNPLKYVYIVYKPKCYKLFCPSVKICK